jgi:hypothetical protein
MREELRLRHSKTSFYRSCLDTYPHAIEISYESLFESENSRRTIALLEDFLGIEITDNDPDYDRIIKDLQGMVVNHREVAEFLQDFAAGSAVSG